MTTNLAKSTKRVERRTGVTVRTTKTARELKARIKPVVDLGARRVAAFLRLVEERTLAGAPTTALALDAAADDLDASGWIPGWPERYTRLAETTIAALGAAPSQAKRVAAKRAEWS